MIYLELFLTFLKIGAFTFGGGYAMLPLIQQEVTAKGWMELEQLVNFIAVSESTPGPFAINIATYVGSQVAPLDILGSACATLGVVFPSFVIILIVAKIYDKFKNSKSVQGVMTGLKPAVVGLIGSAIISIALTVFFPVSFTFAVFKSVQFYISLFICILCTVLAFKKVHPIIIICLSAVIGIAAGYLM
ncbi:MAG: chromate transporter [Acutalibacteraceae bacterium]|nr:chromate transporter [Acutalibacteraceae bacterium]